MSDETEIKSNVDYHFDLYGLTALTEKGLSALQAAMSQPVYPFTLMIYETATRVTFNDRDIPQPEAERILHQAAIRG